MQCLQRLKETKRNPSVHAFILVGIEEMFDNIVFGCIHLILTHSLRRKKYTNALVLSLFLFTF